MLDVVTTALEVLGAALLILAAGWTAFVLVPGPLCVSAALVSSAVVAIGASRLLLWAGGEHA